jgi:hypothetical protein
VPILDFGFWILDSFAVQDPPHSLACQFWILDFGFWILLRFKIRLIVWRANFGFWILDFGFFCGSRSASCGREQSKIVNLKSKIVALVDESNPKS